MEDGARGKRVGGEGGRIAGVAVGDQVIPGLRLDAFSTEILVGLEGTEALVSSVPRRRPGRAGQGRRAVSQIFHGPIWSPKK